MDYLDDFVVFSQSVEDHKTHFRGVLSLLATAEVTLKLEKCRFIADTIAYLRYVIRPCRLEISQDATHEIHGLKKPTKITNLKYFLGLCNLFRLSVPNFARIVATLNARLRKDEPAKFGSLSDVEKKSMTDLQKNWFLLRYWNFQS